MNEFIYNDGSTAHRGVWHLVEGETVKRVVPEKITSDEFPIRDHHANECALNRGTYWDSRERAYVRPTVCDCGHSGEVIGKYTRIHVSPAHSVISAERVACNQVGRLSTGGLKYNWGRSRKRKDGDVETVTDGVIRPLYATGDEFPAGPWCSRCQAKLDLRLAERELAQELSGGWYDD